MKACLRNHPVYILNLRRNGSLCGMGPWMEEVCKNEHIPYGRDYSLVCKQYSEKDWLLYGFRTFGRMPPRGIRGGAAACQARIPYSSILYRRVLWLISRRREAWVRFPPVFSRALAINSFSISREACLMEKLFVERVWEPS